MSCSKHITNPTINLLIISLIFPSLGQTGVILQLVPFKESFHAVRLVPNTLELNDIIDQTLDSIRRSPEMKNSNPLFIDGMYKHFSHQMSNESVYGILQTSSALLWNLTDVARSGNAYIYNNEEDSIQVVTQLVLNPLNIEYKQYNLTIGKFKETGSVDGTVDPSLLDVQITLRVRQNNSRPLIFVCDGKVDELSLNPGEVHFTVTTVNGNQELQSVVSDTLTGHFINNVFPQLQKILTSSMESVVRRDEQLCYYLVLCNSCEMYASDS